MVVIAALAVAGTAAPSGAKTRQPPANTPEAWAERFCTGYQAFQAAALDARDAGLPVVRTPATDRTQVRTSAKSLQTALKPPTVAAREMTRDVERRAPQGKGGAPLRAGMADAVARVTAAYEAASGRAQELVKATAVQFQKRAPLVLTRLDADLDRAAKPLARVERLVRKSAVLSVMVAVPACRRVGIDWAPLDGIAATGSTPAPEVVTAGAVGTDDVTAPSILLPGRYRPTPDVAAAAARTNMTGLGRTYFYGSTPVIETGASFQSHCPSPEASTLQVLGCYHEQSIYVLAVTKPELASVVDVTAAHEMLHAVYDGMDSTERAAIDPQLSAFYDASTDAHLHSIVARYEARTPANRSNELHSLIPTQVTTLTPQLDAYYAQYFRDRTPTTAAYTAYISVFDGLISRYRDLDAQLDDLAARITSLRDQSNAAGGEAQRLGSQIDSLRAQGRFGESNTLVPAHNDAVRRAQSLSSQANGLIGQYNALVAEINGVAAELGGLEAALRPTS